MDYCARILMNSLVPARTTRILPRHGLVALVLRQAKNTKPPYIVLHGT